jgi:hypothetical protein
MGAGPSGIKPGPAVPAGGKKVGICGSARAIQEKAEVARRRHCR